MKKYWIHTITPEMLSVFGQTRKTNSKVEVFHCAFAKRIGRNKPLFFPTRLKSVARLYKFEANQLNEGRLSRIFKRKESKASDRFVSYLNPQASLQQADTILQIFKEPSAVQRTSLLPK